MSSQVSAYRLRNRSLGYVPIVEVSTQTRGVTVAATFVERQYMMVATLSTCVQSMRYIGILNEQVQTPNVPQAKAKPPVDLSMTNPTLFQPSPSGAQGVPEPTQSPR